MRACPQCGKQFDDSTSFCSEDGTRLSDLDTIQVGNHGPAVGDVLGNYRLVDIVGEGGMGRVYLAEHIRLGRKVALKLLHPEYAENPSAVRRFFGEARAVNQIEHDNIVSITDFVEEGPHKYYIMELLAGASLADEEKALGVLPLERQLDIATQVASALGAVHEAGIIHRDLKPDNIFLTEHAGRKDFVKLLDFGVAKLSDLGDGTSLGRTAAGAILGTPEYMSPEQVSGKVVDNRSDIYSMGVILYELATGRKPLEAKSFGEMVIKHLTILPVPPTQLDNLPQPIPRELEDLILRCLEKSPDDRPQSMAEVEEVLRALAVGDEEALRHSPRPRRRRRRRAPWPLAAGITTLAVAFAGGAWIVHQRNIAAAALARREAVARAKRAQAAARPAKVTLSFNSQPTGAQVYRHGNRTALGKTPFALKVGRSRQLLSFDFKLPGFYDARETVAPTEDSRVEVSLTRLPVHKRLSTRSRRGRMKRHQDRRATLDPFADE